MALPNRCCGPKTGGAGLVYPSVKKAAALDTILFTLGIATPSAEDENLIPENANRCTEHVARKIYARTANAGELPSSKGIRTRFCALTHSVSSLDRKSVCGRSLPTLVARQAAEAHNI